VQEWKNILLRGDSSEALGKYQRAFDDEYSEVQRTLGALDTAAQGLAPLNLNLDEIIAEHAAMKRRYDAALEPFAARNGASPRQTDAEVRGIDRTLTLEIDNIGATVTAQSVALREAIGRSAAERYRNIVLYTLIANLIIAALVIVILLISLSSLRAR
jgi:methyl-accepting chemotaxis protein